MVESPTGRSILRVLVSDRTAPGHPFAPMHWTGKTAPSGRVDAVVPALTDPVSGQPASKSAAVAIRPLAVAWYGFALSGHDLRPDCTYWAKAPVAGGVQLELAGTEAPADWVDWASRLFGTAPAMSVADPARGIHRFAFSAAGRITGALFIAPEPVRLARSHLATMLDNPRPDLLAGHPGADQPDPGPTVCACMNVGLNTILGAILDRGILSVEALGTALGAGTNCGSCRPELAALIQRHRHREAAE